MAVRALHHLALVGSAAALTINAVTRAAVSCRGSGISMNGPQYEPTQNDFRYGIGPISGSTGGPRPTGGPMTNNGPFVSMTQNMHMGQPNNPQDDFRFGSGRTVVGNQGGYGKGMGNDVTPSMAMGAPHPADDFRFGVSRTVVGFQGGAGKGMGNEMTSFLPMGAPNPADDFRFGASRTVIGFQGGAGKGMGNEWGAPRPGIGTTQPAPAPQPAEQMVGY